MLLSHDISKRKFLNGFYGSPFMLEKTKLKIKCVIKHLKSDILSVSAQYFDLYDNYAIKDKISIKYQLWLRNSCGLANRLTSTLHYTAQY